MRSGLLPTLLVLCLTAGDAVLKGRPAKRSQAADAPLKRNFTMKTLGGRHFWGDVAFFHQFRIQQNVISKHYRLLDGDDYRHASGSLKKCRAKLAEIRQRLKLPPMKGQAVILIHGITRSSKAVHKMQQRLRQEGYAVFAFNYPSSRVDIPESAVYLKQVIDSLEGIGTIHFVVHSMGGLIVRSYLCKNCDKRIGRMVMVGVPNKGARLADTLKKNVIYKLIFGPAGQQLVSGKNGFISKLPVPSFPFAVIAGARGTLNGYNPLIPGDDDGMVSVSSSRLPGAADFMTVKCLHSFLMSHAVTIDAATRFLKTGRLRAKGKPHPIPKAVKRPANRRPK